MLASHENVCAGCGAEWDTLQLNAIFLSGPKTSSRPIELAAILSHAHLSLIFLARLSCLATVSVQPHSLSLGRGEASVPWAWEGTEEGQ
jgi:hypothetical protein